MMRVSQVKKQPKVKVAKKHQIASGSIKMGSVDDTSSYESSSQITNLKGDKEAEHGFKLPQSNKERAGSITVPRPS